MKVWLRYDEYMAWYAKNHPFDEDTTHFESGRPVDVVGTKTHETFGKVAICWQKLQISERMTATVSFDVPLQFIELSEYDNYTGSEA